jgi:hypothetical protein
MNFSQWLRMNHRDLPPPDKIQALISASGSAGVSEKELRSFAELPRELFDDLLRALVTSGQIRFANRNGEVVYYGIGV